MMVESPPNHDLVFPVNCPLCSQLSFFFKTASGSKMGVLDNFAPLWEKHPCCEWSGEEYWSHPSLSHYLRTSWGKDEFYFKDTRLSYEKQKKKHKVGAILRVRKKSDSFLVKFLTEDANLLEARLPLDMKEISAGMLLDLSSLTFVQDKKNRLKEVKEIRIPLEKLTLKTRKMGFCQISFQGKDQEKLENYIDQVIRQSKENHCIPISVVPQTNEEEEDSIYFSRQVTFPNHPWVLAQLQKLPLPKEIRISIRQSQMDF